MADGERSEISQAPCIQRVPPPLIYNGPVNTGHRQQPEPAQFQSPSSGQFQVPYVSSSPSGSVSYSTPLRVDPRYSYTPNPVFSCAGLGQQTYIPPAPVMSIGSFVPTPGPRYGPPPVLFGPPPYSQAYMSSAQYAGSAIPPFPIRGPSGQFTLPSASTSITGQSGFASMRMNSNQGCEDSSTERNHRRSDPLGYSSEPLERLIKVIKSTSLTVTKFAGQPATFLPWLTQIENGLLKSELESAVILSKLLAACKGEAHSLIESCVYLPPELAVERVITLLKERYGAPETITDDLLSKLIVGEDIREDRALQFIASVGTAQEALSNLDRLEEDRTGICQLYSRLADSPQYLGRLVARLPRTWRSSFMSKYAGSMSLRSLRTFLEDKGKSLSSPVARMVTQLTKERYRARASSPPPGNSANVFTTTEGTAQCEFCASRVHSLNKCAVFRIDMTARGRYTFLRARKLCFVCYGKMHSTGACPAASCVDCATEGCQWDKGRAHHEQLCLFKPPSKSKKPQTQANATTENREASDANPIEDIDPNTDPRNTDALTDNEDEEGFAFHSVSIASGDVFMNVVPVNVKNPISGQVVSTFAMLDPCANVDVVSKDIISTLQIPVDEATASISTVNGNLPFKGRAGIQVSGLQPEAVTIDIKDMCVLPCQHFRRLRVPQKMDCKKWPELQRIWASRQAEMEIPRVTLLLSMKRPGLHRPVGPIVETGAGFGPILTPTVLGIVVAGYADPACKGSNVVHFTYRSSASGEENLPWTIPDIKSLYSPDVAPSFNQSRVLDKMRQSTYKLDDGAIEVGVPWKNEVATLPDNLVQAEKVLNSQRQKFRDKALLAEYSAQIQKHVTKGHAQRIPRHEINRHPGKRFYLIHHAVRHPRKRKLRVVMNGKKKYKGQSLNMAIASPPNLLSKIHGPQLVFREHAVAVSGDIEDFYYNVRTPSVDWDYFRFLWFDNDDPEGDLAHFRFRVHIFGGIASQAAAILALQKAITDGAATPEQAEKFITSFYSDDHLTSYDSAQQAIQETVQLREILKTGSFRLTKFSSNAPKVLEQLSDPGTGNAAATLSESPPANTMVTVLEGESSALGLLWNTVKDVLVYRFAWDVEPNTKRQALSVLMKINFDPPGLVAPYKMPFKILVRDIVCSETDWDSPLPESTLTKLQQRLDALKAIELVEIPRCIAIVPKGANICRELHIFCDGSEHAYGACAYVRTMDKSETFSVCSLVRSKDKLTPKRRVLTIPKIELSACALGIQLAKEILQYSSLVFDHVYYWTDSLCVLAMIANTDKRFQVFVAHRLAQIQSCSVIAQWKYVPSELNVADVLSRGCGVANPSDGLSDQWFIGPEFLRIAGSEAWPPQPSQTSERIQELTPIELTVHVVLDGGDLRPWFTKINSWFKVIYHAAVWLRFKQLLLNRVRIRKGLAPGFPVIVGRVTVTELRRAELAVIGSYQCVTFPEEMAALRSGRQIPSNSALVPLRPVLDNGIICVGGRLKHAVALTLSSKHPAILSSSGHFTELIVDWAHRLSVHGSVNQILTDLRMKYWIIGAKRTVKKLASRCLACKKFRVQHGQQIMADLPHERLAIREGPFTHTGVDLFGPLLVKRGRSEAKRWVAIYTCMTTRAVHLEALNSMDQHDFLDSFHRFRARRGNPKTVRSDQGGNFTAANAEFQVEVPKWNQGAIHHELLQIGVDWSFSPPYGPHHNGAIERMVGIVKRVLRHTLAGRVVDEAVFTTLVVEAEGIVNSRPLTEFSSDPKDLRPLTPYDILLLRPQRPIPFGVFEPNDRILLKSYRTAQYCANQFWSRFVKEYVLGLQERKKWVKELRDFRLGDLVLLVEQTPRGLWRMGRITKTKVGEDGHVRSVTVLTSTGEYERSITKICLLEATT